MVSGFLYSTEEVLHLTPTGTAVAVKAGSESELLFSHILRQFQKFSK
jgi:hypothetical protein